MKQKETFLKKLLPVEKRVLIDVLLLAVLSAATFLFPYAKYSYKKVVYGFNGYNFLTGANIMKRTVHVAPVPMLWVFVAIVALLIVLAVVFKRMKPKLGAGLMLILGVLQMAMAVLTNTQLEGMMAGAKNVTAGWGLTGMMLLGVLVMIRAFYTMYQLGMINALDFMVFPAGIYLLINNYFPMVGLFIAFKNIDYSVGILNSPWCGFSNFRYLFTTSDAWLITRNTLLYNLAFIVVGNLVGIIVGLCLANVINKRMQKLYQTTILLPQLISYVIVAYIVFAFLSNEAGLLTKAIEKNGAMYNFYADRKWWPYILIAVFNWKGIGYSAIIYLAAITGIDKNLYEAASIDGAGRVQQIFRITLPMIRSTIITLVLLQIGRMFYSDFGLFYQVPMNAGMLFNVTQTIDTYVYRMLMINNRVGMASAASFYQSIVGFVLVMLANFIVRKVSREDALF